MVMFHSYVNVYQRVHPNTSNSRHGTLTDQLRHCRNCCSKNSVLHVDCENAHNTKDSINGIVRIVINHEKSTGVANTLLCYNGFSINLQLNCPFLRRYSDVTNSIWWSSVENM